MTNSKDRAKKRAKAQRIADGNLAINVPSNIELIRFDTEEYDQLTKREKDAYLKARSLVEKYWSFEKGSASTDLFTDYEDKNQVRDLVFNLLDDPQMMEVEKKFYLKFGEFNSLPYAEWAHKVFALFPEQVHFTPDEEIFDKAYNNLLNTLKTVLPDGLKPISIVDALTSMTSGKNSGFPFFTSKWNDKDEDGELLTEELPQQNGHSPASMTNYYSRMAQTLVNGKDIVSNTPYILFKRVQNDGITSKMRAVEAPSKAEAIAAKSFTRPLMDAMKTLSEFTGFNGGEKVYLKAQQMFTRKYVVEGDFSSFDATCGPLMPTIFKLLKELTNHTHDSYFNIIENYYKYPTIITPQGVVKSKSLAGLMSGSGWTTIIGTLCNSLAVRYACYKMGNKHGDFINYASGDDIALSCEVFDVSMFESSMYDLNLLCNKDKQQFSLVNELSYYSFLGYYHFKGETKKGKFPVMRSLPKLVYSESYLDLEKLIKQTTNLTPEELNLMREAKASDIGILSTLKKLENLQAHNNFEQIVEIVKKNAKSELDLTRVIPFIKLEKLLRTGRTNESSKLMDSPVVEILLKLEISSTNDEIPNEYHYDSDQDITPKNIEEIIDCEFVYLEDNKQNQHQHTGDELNSKPHQLTYLIEEFDKVNLQIEVSHGEFVEFLNNLELDEDSQFEEEKEESFPSSLHDNENELKDTHQCHHNTTVEKHKCDTLVKKEESLEDEIDPSSLGHSWNFHDIFLEIFGINIL